MLERVKELEKAKELERAKELEKAKVLERAKTLERAKVMAKNCEYHTHTFSFRKATDTYTYAHARTHTQPPTATHNLAKRGQLRRGGLQCGAEYDVVLCASLRLPVNCALHFMAIFACDAHLVTM